MRDLILFSEIYNLIFLDELDAQIFLLNNRTNVYINQYIWYNIYMEKDIYLNEKLNSGFGPNARVNSI